jgi:hypothetical protein
MASAFYKKEDYQHMARIRVVAFKEIAKRLGKEHPITRMMGSLAWGRHDWEQGPQPNLHGAIGELYALNGVFSVLNAWARDHDSGAQRLMLSLWPRGFESSPHGKGEK